MPGKEPEALSSSEPPINEDMHFQRMDWRVRRIGWCLLGLVVVAGLLGVFSHGVFSTTTVRSADERLRVTHERFYRNAAPTGIDITAARRADSPTLHLILAGGLQHAFTIEQISPNPTSSYSDDDGLHLLFDGIAGSRSLIRLSLLPDAPGRASGTIGLADGSAVSLWQFIHP